MTVLLEKAFSEATQLSEMQQDHLAHIIFDIMADEKHWDELFAKSQTMLENMANEALAEYESGSTKPCACKAK